MLICAPDVNPKTVVGLRSLFKLICDLFSQKTLHKLIFIIFEIFIRLETGGNLLSLDTVMMFIARKVKEL